MPFYTFRCADCGADREVMTDLKTAEGLDLMCINCGGSMTKAPVLSLRIIGPATEARKNARDAEAENIFKPCGHRYACRCGVRLSKTNPFKEEIKRVHGFGDED